MELQLGTGVLGGRGQNGVERRVAGPGEGGALALLYELQGDALSSSNVEELVGLASVVEEAETLLVGGEDHLASLQEGLLNKVELVVVDNRSNGIGAVTVLHRLLDDRHCLAD